MKLSSDIMAKLTSQQKEIMDSLGFKNQRAVAAVFILIAFLIVGINIGCRFSGNRKLEKYPHVEGIVTGNQVYTEHIGSKTRHRNSLTVEYYPEGSDMSLSWYDDDGPYEFMNKGDKLRVYYDPDSPSDAFIAKKDWVTGIYIRADVFYDAAFIVAVWPLIIGWYLFADYSRAKKRALKGDLKAAKKVKCSADPDYDPNLHDLARMANAKRGWLPFWICGILFYIFALVMGIGIIVSVIKDKPQDSFSPAVAAIFMMILGHGMLAGVIFSMRYLGRKKRAFIKGFMTDEATAVYEDRMTAADVLWKLVKHYMEKEPFYSRFKLEYNRDWLETYEEKLIGFKREEAEEVTVPKKMPANMEELASMAGEIGFEVRTVDDGRQKPYLEVSRQEAPSSDMVVELLGLLTYEYVLEFFDSFYWSPTDPGRYVSVYMTEGSPVYHFGNHGWSSDYKYLSCSEMADLIVKNWDKYDGSNYKNYIKISTNLWSSRDKDKYYRVISRKG